MAISYALPTIKNFDSFRRGLNAILGDVKSKQATYGASLPGSTAGYGDGALFVLNGTPNHIYQVQGSAWVLVV